MDTYFNIQLIIFIVIALALFLGGFILWNKIKASHNRLKEEMEALKKHIMMKEETIYEQKQSLKELTREKQYLSTMLLVLPDLAKELSSTIALKDIEYTIIKIPIQMLEGRFAMLHYLEGEKLTLKRDMGLRDDEAKDYKEIKLGAGKIGFTARKQMVMTSDDFERESKLMKDRILGDRERGLKIDMCAPLIHRGKIYGVLSVGEVSNKKDDARILMGLIANLGAIALENALIFDEIQRQSDVDWSTGLYNLTYFYKYLDRELKKSARYIRPLEVVIFDIDHLREYNELFGHLEGENVIRVIGGIIKKSLRNIDIPCRYGGGSYGIILPETDKEKALMVAERIRKEVEEYPFSLKKVTISGGIAAYPEKGSDANLLLKEAELNLSVAKGSGRNRIIG